ncbi:MAG TPA: class I SAM-dependent methyltransferase [Nannocystis sp.]
MASTTGRKLALADRADRFDLYQKAVSCPADNIEFVERVYAEMRGTMPRVLREDFCGTAHLATEWARRGPRRRAIGVDLDPEALAWARRHNLAAAGSEIAARVRLVHADVRDTGELRADVVCALNFSYFLLPARQQLLAYFRAVRRSLRPRGLFVFDCIGGAEAIVDYREEREYDGFSYIWEHRRFNPLDHTARCTISFAFPDGSKIAPAFTYHWRLWTLPELRDLLAEAGFASPRVFWECTDDDGETCWRENAHDHSQAIWLTYLVAST